MRLAAALTAVVMLGAAAIVGAPGCGPPCSPSERVYTGGDLKRGTGYLRYETSVPTGPFIPYNGGTVLHIKHGLGVRPDTVEVFLSFSDTPEELGHGGSTPAAGNQALLLKQDENEIAVQNDTCADAYIRVVATAIVDSSDAGAEAGAEAGTDAGTDAAHD